MGRRNGKYHVFFLIFLSWIQLLVAEDLSITITANPNPAPINAQIQIQIQVSGKEMNLPEIPRPDLSEFTVLSGPNISSSVQIINFEVKTSRVITYVVVPKRTGTVVIPPISLRYKGKTISSNELKITITKEVEAGQNRQDKEVFLVAEIPKKEFYLYEPVPVIFKLYIHGRVRDNSLRLISSPEFQGFWVENIEKEIPPHQEIINAKRFVVYTLQQYVLFPIQTGELTISPMRISLDLLIKSSGSPDPFGFFEDFDGFFGNYSVKNVILQSEEKSVTIKRIPLESDHTPILVGNYDLQVKNTDFSGEALNAITVRFTIKGNGYLGHVKQLPIQFPSQFEVYDPKITRTSKFENGQYFSSLTLEYILIPGMEGKFNTPQSEIPIFDPVSQKSSSLIIPALHFNIAASSNSWTFQGRNQISGIRTEDIRYLKTEIGNLTGKDNLSPIGWSTFAIFVLNFVLLGIGVFVARIKKKETMDSGFRRYRRSKKLAVKRLKRAHELLHQHKIREFSEEMFKAITTFVSDRLNMENKQLTASETINALKNVLGQHELLQRVEHFLIRTEALRFAPVNDQGQEMQSMYDEGVQLLIELQKYL